MESKTNKILWISILQGWAMLLVVLGHTGFVNADGSPNFKICDIVHDGCYSFHMPLFMFVSGGLFYMTRIKKEWSFGKMYVDKLKRLAIPAVFFITMTFFPKILAGPFMARQVSMNWRDILEGYVNFDKSPLGEMWFVSTLLLLMLMYPVYRYALKSWKTEVLLVAICLTMRFCMFPQFSYNLFAINQVCYYVTYFVAGMLFFKYECHNRFNPWIVGGASLLLFPILSYWHPIPLLTQFNGIVMSISLSLILAEKLTSLFSSFRDYTYQIFLMGIFPQILVQNIIWNLAGRPLVLAPIFYLTSVLSGLYLPVIISKCVEIINVKQISILFGLK